MMDLHDRHKPLAFRSFTFDKDGEMLFERDRRGRNIPAYAIETPKLSKPLARIARIEGSSWDPRFTSIGTISRSSKSIAAKTGTSPYGRKIQIKKDATIIREGQVFRYPPFGDLEWKEDARSGAIQQLWDDTGRVLAMLRWRRHPTGHETGRIEVLVPGDEAFVDLVVLTGLAIQDSREKGAKQMENAIR